MEGIGLKKGILINFVTKYSNILIQLFITSILARILTPEDYGIVAVITIFIVFFNLLGDMGIGPAIIQYKDLDDNDISSIFIFTYFIAIILSIIFFFFSYFITFIYGNKIYITLGHLLCFSVLFNVLSIVPNSLLLKNKKFKLVGIVSIITGSISGAITIALACLKFSYYALVLNSIIQSVLNFLILTYLSKIKIRIKSYSFRPIKRIGKFSSYQFMFNFVNYFSRNLDNLLIGRFIGIEQLGYYDKAYKLMLYPVQNLTFVITPVLQPILSDYQHRKEIILEQYMKIVKILALLGTFISTFCFFSSKEIIIIMFGQGWLGSINSFKILSISIMFQIILSSSGSIFQATNNTKELFKSGCFVAITSISLIICGICIGKIEFVSIGILLAYIINFIIVFYYLIVIVFKRKFTEFLMHFKNYLIILACMITIFSFFNFKISNCLLSIAYKFFVSACLYSLLLLVTGEFKVMNKYFRDIVIRRSTSD